MLIKAPNNENIPRRSPILARADRKDVGELSYTVTISDTLILSVVSFVNLT